MAKWLEADGFGPEPGWPDKGHDGSQEAGAVEKVGASGSEGPEKVGLHKAHQLQSG